MSTLCTDKRLRIFWFGGEPLLNYAVIEYITDQLLAKGFILDTNIITNGSLITEEQIHYLTSHYQSITVQITIDDLNDKYYDVKRYVDIEREKAFDRTIDGIKLLLRNNVKVKIRVNFKTSDIHKSIQIYKTLISILEEYDNGNLLVYLAPLSLHGTKEIMSSFQSEHTHPYVQLLEIQRQSGFLLQDKSVEGILQSFELFPRCSFCGITAKKRVTIDANGDLYKCHRLVGRKEFSVGDVINGIDEDCSIYRLFRCTDIRDPQCLSCSLLPICQGGCKGNELLYGPTHKCHNIKQVQPDVVKMCYEELTKAKDS